MIGISPGISSCNWRGKSKGSVVNGAGVDRPGENSVDGRVFGHAIDSSFQSDFNVKGKCRGGGGSCCGDSC